MLHLPYDECREIERTHCCPECKQPLVTVWDGEVKSYAVGCLAHLDQEGFERLLSPTQARKAGMQLPMEVEQQFKRKEQQQRGFADRLRDQVTTDFESEEDAKMREQKQEGKDPASGLLPMSDAGTGTALVVAQREMVLEAAQRAKLDPFLGHVILYFGRPYVTEAGLLYHAHRSGKFEAMTSRPLTEEERKDHMIAEGEHAWIAKVYKEGFSEPFTGLGRAREDEKRPIARGSAVEPQHPQRMAEKRAEMQALRKAFPIGLPVLEGGEGEEEGKE